MAIHHIANRILSLSCWTLHGMPFQKVTQAVGLIMPSKQRLSHPKMILNEGIVCPRGNSHGPSLLCRHLLLNIGSGLRNRSLHSHARAPHMKYARTYPHNMTQPLEEAMPKPPKPLNNAIQ